MSALARLEVMELIGRYQECVDAGDDEAYAANFTPDGVVESPSGIFRGREELKGMFRDLVRRGRIGGE
ncbi:MAG TPA: nuclear transport factor 2 family protein, partial [Dehalococcoidia bacterium]|nr:nuclear transport factor 2 family protein [Dehalococcoidia bacterium]